MKENEFLQLILDEIEKAEKSREESLEVGAGDYYIGVNLMGTLKGIKAMIKKRLEEG